MQLQLKVASSIQTIDACAWDVCAGPHPFMQYAFLSALETSGALGCERGIMPKYILLYNDTHGNPPTSIFNIMHVDLRMAKQFQQAGALISYEGHAFWYNKNYVTPDDYLKTLRRKKRLQFQ